MASDCPHNDADTKLIDIHEKVRDTMFYTYHAWIISTKKCVLFWYMSLPNFAIVGKNACV